MSVFQKCQQSWPKLYPQINDGHQHSRFFVRKQFVLPDPPFSQHDALIFSLFSLTVYLVGFDTNTKRLFLIYMLTHVNNLRVRYDVQNLISRGNNALKLSFPRGKETKRALEIFIIFIDLPNIVSFLPGKRSKK